MKLCVIGNSHAGMLAAAYREWGLTDVDLTFFARPSMLPTDLQLEGSVVYTVVPEFIERLAKNNVPPRVNLAEYDGIIFVGLTVSVFTGAQCLLNHAVYGWPSTSKLMTTNYPAKRHFLSEPALQETLRHLIQNSPACAMSMALADQKTGPVFIVPQPYPSVQILESKRKSPIIKRLHRNNEGHLLGDALEQSHKSILEPIERVKYISQDPDTIEHGFLTSAPFSRNSVRLNIDQKHNKNDVLHANAPFGKRVLANILNRIRAKV